MKTESIRTPWANDGIIKNSGSHPAPYGDYEPAPLKNGVVQPPTTPTVPTTTTTKPLFPNQSNSIALDAASTCIGILRTYNVQEFVQDGSDRVLVSWLSKGQAWKLFYAAKDAGLNPYVSGDRNNYVDEFSISIPVRQWNDGSGFCWLKVVRKRSTTFIGKGGGRDYNKERWGIDCSYRHIL